MTMTCPLGLICEPDCINASSCYHWTKPWPLPYFYDPETETLVVCIRDTKRIYPPSSYSFEDFDFDIAREWTSHGFADAIALPYNYNLHVNGLYVTGHKPESGFHHAISLPYYRQQLDDGCWYLQVIPSDYKAIEAGWVEAWLIDDVPF
jgi:hypothetical protein